MKLLSLSWTTLLLAALGVYLLEVFPYTGIFLMFLGGPLLPGLLIDLALVSLFLDGAAKRSRALMAIPVVMLALYYGYYLQQMWAQHQENAALAASNPGLVQRFDPTRQSLIAPRLSLVRYAVPVVYQPSGDKGEYRASRLLSQSDCQSIQLDPGAHVFKTYPAAPGGKRLCELTTTITDALPLQPVELAATPHRYGEDGSEVVELRIGGVARAHFTRLHRHRVSLFPLFLAGCFLNDGAASWDCQTGFLRSPVTLDGYEIASGNGDEGRPAEVMLGLRRWRDEELNDYRGFASNDAAVGLARQEAGREQEEITALFRGLLAGDDVAIPGGAYILARDPAPWAPQAKVMARRFTSLLASEHENDAACTRENLPLATEAQKRDGHAPGDAIHGRNDDVRAYYACLQARTSRNRGQQLLVLAGVLEALPPDAYAPVAADIFAAMQRPDALRRFPVLYLRSADMGPPAEAFFAQAFRDSDPGRYESLVPVLALCRVGQADAATMAELKRRFTLDGKGLDDYRAALALALIKLGQKDFVAANKAMLTRAGAYDVWLQTVLAGTGATATGPANCMIPNWTFGGTMGKVMESSLVYARGGSFVPRPPEGSRR